MIRPRVRVCACVQINFPWGVACGEITSCDLWELGLDWEKGQKLELGVDRNWDWDWDRSWDWDRNRCWDWDMGRNRSWD
jgi:hypothetical protein